MVAKKHIASSVISPVDAISSESRTALHAPSGKATVKQQSKRDKAEGNEVGRSFANLGLEDAKLMLSAAQSVAQTKQQVMSNILKLGSSENFKSYLSGWATVLAELNITDKAAYDTLKGFVSEIKRVHHAAYGNKDGKGAIGIDKTVSIMDGKGTWREKIKSLPPMSTQKPGSKKQGKKSKATASKVATVESIKEAMEATEKAVKQGKPTAQVIHVESDQLRNLMLYSVDTEQIPAVFAGLLAKMRMTKDPLFTALADTLQADWEKVIKADASKETAGDMPQTQTRRQTRKAA